jgi:tRNA dimethylallyltransferase
MSDERPRVAVITGPTATGKSRVALDATHALASEGIDACIISMDSVQVYRHMDIGTDKLAPGDREGVEHHLIDVVDPDETFSAAQFAKSADRIIEDTHKKGGAAVIAGGTGFYLRALQWGLFPGPGASPEIRERLSEEAGSEGLESLYEQLSEIDPESASRIHPNDQVRIIRALEVYEVTGEPISAHFARQSDDGPRYPALIIGLETDRELMYERINARVCKMMDQGLVDEVRRLREMGYGRDLPSQQALGYKQTHMLIDGEIDRERAVYLIQRDTRHYARRQLTWLRAEPDLRWVPVEKKHEIVTGIVKFIKEGNE